MASDAFAFASDFASASAACRSCREFTAAFSLAFAAAASDADFFCSASAFFFSASAFFCAASALRATSSSSLFFCSPFLTYT